MSQNSIVHYKGEESGIKFSEAFARATDDGAKYLLVKRPAFGNTIATPITDNVELETVLNEKRGVSGIKLYEVGGDQQSHLPLNATREKFKLDRITQKWTEELRL